MKKTLKNLLVVLLAVTAVFCLAFGLTACGETGLTELKIENAKTEFYIGDEFEFGEDFAVYAVYADGTEKDVTEEITYKTEAGFDMNTAGNYLITISYGGKKFVYTIYVNDADNVLKKIELDSSSVKKTYSLGDDVSFDGLVIKKIYENAQGQLIETVTTSLKDFTVLIKDAEGHVVTDVYDRLATFTVTLSLGGISDSFTVEVNNVDIATVQGAIFAAVSFKENIVSGTEVVHTTRNGKTILSQDFEYLFGDNYTYINEKATTELDTDKKYHYSMEESGLFCAYFVDGVQATSPSNTGYFEGTPFAIWFLQKTYYGAEKVLNELFSAGKISTNEDLVQTADPNKREYTFSFSGLMNFPGSSCDYNETTVEFKLSEDYTLEYLWFTQSTWQENTGDGLIPTYITGSDGKTVPNGDYTINYTFEVNQQSGERTEQNPYSDASEIKSYDLIYNGENLGSGDVVINCATSNSDPKPSITIYIDNILPLNANFETDILYFDWDGNVQGKQNSATTLTGSVYCFPYRQNNEIKVRLDNGGVFVLYLITEKITKTITFNIEGVAPTSMTAQIGNTSNNRFINGNSQSLSLGGTVYFRGAVNSYANEAQTATVTSGSADSVTISETTFGGVNCFKFSASQAGTYTVKVTSDVNSSVSCSFTFTVNPAPDYASILSGKYSATDYIGDIFTVEFTPSTATADSVSGKVVITKTNTDDNTDTVQTLNYSVDFTNNAIVLTPVSGTNLGADLLVNGSKLYIEDQYGNKFELTRAND